MLDRCTSFFQMPRCAAAQTSLNPVLQATIHTAATPVATTHTAATPVRQATSHSADVQVLINGLMPIKLLDVD